jgi:hypothetical protein
MFLRTAANAKQAVPSAAQMLAVLNNTIHLAEARIAFNRSYCTFCETCTDAEYTEFYHTFMPSLRVPANGKILEPVVTYFANKILAKDYFYTVGLNYQSLVNNVKEYLDDEQEPEVKEIDALYLSLLVWQANLNNEFNYVERALRTIYAQQRWTFANRDHLLLQRFKEFSVPEAIFIEQLIQSLDKLVSPVVRRTIETINQMNSVVGSTLNQIERAQKGIITDLQKQLSKQIAANEAELKLLISNKIVSVYVTDPEESEKFESTKAYALELAQAPFEHEKPLDSYNAFYDIHEALESCKQINLELQTAKKNVKKAAQKTPVGAKQSASTGEPSLQKQSDVAALTAQAAQLSLGEEEKSPTTEEAIREQQLQEAIKAKNAEAALGRDNWREVKRKAYEDKLRQDEEISALKNKVAAKQAEPEYLVLSKDHYNTLSDIFAEKHNTIKYGELVNLVTCAQINGEVTMPNGGGGTRKITLGKFDIYVLEPEAGEVSGGLHFPHQAGHNKKTLIKPIVRDIKRLFENAGITPDTCKIRNELQYAIRN